MQVVQTSEPSVDLGLFALDEKINIRIEHSDLQSCSEIILEVESLPSTGYSWSIVKEENLLLQENRIFAKDKDPEIVGGGVIERYRFLLSGGEPHHLLMQYFRPWEKEEDRNTPGQIEIRIEREDQ